MRNFFLFLCFFLVQLASSQTILKYDTNGNVKDYNDLKMDPNAVRAALVNNKRALELYNAGRSKKTVGNILLWGGSTVLVSKFLVDLTTDTPRNSSTSGNGYVTNISNDRVSPTLYIVGGAMIIAAIPVKIGFSRKIEKAVKMNNEEVNKKAVGFRIDESYFISNSNGVGVGVRF